MDNNEIPTDIIKLNKTEVSSLKTSKYKFLVIIIIITLLVTTMIIFLFKNSDKVLKTNNKVLYSALENSLSIKYLSTERIQTSEQPDGIKIEDNYIINSDVTNPKILNGQAIVKRTFSNNTDNNKIYLNAEMLVFNKEIYTKYLDNSSYLDTYAPIGLVKDTWIYGQQDRLYGISETIVSPQNLYTAQSALGDIIIGNFEPNIRKDIIDKIIEMKVYEISKPLSSDGSKIVFSIKENLYAVEELNKYISELIQIPYERNLVFYDNGILEGTVTIDTNRNLITDVELSGHTDEFTMNVKRIFSYPAEAKQIEKPKYYLDVKEISKKYYNTIPEDCKNTSLINYLNKDICNGVVL